MSGETEHGDSFRRTARAAASVVIEDLGAEFDCGRAAPFRSVHGYTMSVLATAAAAGMATVSEGDIVVLTAEIESFGRLLQNLAVSMIATAEGTSIQ